MGHMCPALRRVYRHVWSINHYQSVDVKKSRKTPRPHDAFYQKYLPETVDVRSSMHHIKAHYKHFVEE